MRRSIVQKIKQKVIPSGGKGYVSGNRQRVERVWIYISILDVEDTSKVQTFI